MNIIQIAIVPLVLLLIAFIQMVIAARFRNSSEISPKQTSYYLSFVALQATVFYLGFIGMALVSRNPSLSLPILIALATLLAVISALIVTPLAEYARNLLKHLVSRRTQARDDKEVVKHYSERLSTALDIQRLADTVLNLMIETLGIERGMVFINDRDAEGNISLRPLASVGATGIEQFRFDSDSPFIDYFRRHEEVLSRETLQSAADFRLLSETERAWLNSLEVAFFVPVLRQRELIGVLAFGIEGATYYEEDLDLMMTLAKQAALAMDSARLFEQLALINQEVGSLNNQLVGMDKRKGDFLSIASHELRTPLTQIHGYSKMILDLTEDELKDPAYVKMMIQGIARGSERMKDVVDMMFDVTEADVGKMSLFLGPVKVEQVVNQASRSLLPAFDERRIALSITGVKDLPALEADGTRLVQAIENLIGNALKFTPDEGLVTVEGKMTTLDNGQPAIDLTVTDTGIGIDPEFHEKIFEKFFRIDSIYKHSTGKTKFKGAGPGLGLTLVKGIAEAHGGKVWVESVGYNEEQCPGSIFHLVIPSQPLSVEEIALAKQANIATRHWKRKDIEDFS